MKSLTQRLMMAIPPLLIFPVGASIVFPVSALTTKSLATSSPVLEDTALQESKHNEVRGDYVNRAIALRPPNPPERPGWGMPGGSRGALSSGENTFTDNALIAFINEGQTLAAYPTLFVYIPEIVSQLIRQNTPLDISFALIDERDRVLYESTRIAPDTSGILGIRLEEMDISSPLEVNNQYRWVISIIALNPSMDLNSPSLRMESSELFGWIQRTNQIDILNENTIPPTARHHFYAEEDIWYDAVTALLELKQANLTESTFDGEIQELLDSVGLNHVSPDAFIGYWSDLQPSVW